MPGMLGMRRVGLFEARTGEEFWALIPPGLGRETLAASGISDLPRPGLVVGDQIATDGVPAWRLGFGSGFVYCQPARGRISLRPCLLHLVGAGLRALLFEVPPFR